MSGQAASYYKNEGFAHPQQPQQPAYGQQPLNYPPQAPYQPEYQQNYQQNYQPSYQQPAEAKPNPEYQQNVPQSGNSFDQAFKIEKPKWNDLWAGLLVRFLCDITKYASKVNSVLADRRLPWIRCCIWNHDSQVCDQQRVQRRRYLRLGQRFLPEHKHPGAIHLRPRSCPRLILAIFHGRKVFHQNFYLGNRHSEHRLCPRDGNLLHRA